MIGKMDLVKVITLILILLILILKYSDEESRTLLIFFLYFLVALFYKLDPRYPILAAIGSLILSAILLVQKKEYLANKVAIYAYYFLVVGVLLNLIEYVREGEKIENVEGK